MGSDTIRSYTGGVKGARVDGGGDTRGVHAKEALFTWEGGGERRDTLIHRRYWRYCGRGGRGGRAGDTIHSYTGGITDVEGGRG